MNETYQEADTARIASFLLERVKINPAGATILGLQGELGAGKTTLVQAMAKQLGVKDTVVSPTFVIAKYYQTIDTRFGTLVHIDAYRIESPDELGPLNFDVLLSTPNTLIIIEWPERIRGALPSHTHFFQIGHTADGRIITSL